MVEKVIEMGDCIIKLIDNTEEFFTAGENESIIYRLRIIKRLKVIVIVSLQD